MNRNQNFKYRATALYVMFMCLIGNSVALMPGHFAPEITKVAVTDLGGQARPNYSTSERVNFVVRINNKTHVQRIGFKFEVYDPQGKPTGFTHTGNSIPGSIGEGGSEVNRIPIANFYTTSGMYTLRVTANGTTKETRFSIYSPNLTLTYPSNFARDLTDSPLVFRWVGSGATRYRIYVDDDAAFFNCLYTADTVGTDHMYPADPSDARQKLSAGTVYYWKVEGLDVSGRVIAQSAAPFNFTVKSSALTSTAKDMAVTGLELKQGKVAVRIKNQGGKAENRVPVSLFLNGRSQGTELIPIIMKDEERELLFEPSVFGTVMAMATLQFEDDYTKNNVMTRQLFIEAPAVSTGTVAGLSTVAGRVSDSASGQALEGVLIILRAIDTRTGAKSESGRQMSGRDGSYKFGMLEPGEYELEAVAAGYEQGMSKSEVKPGATAAADLKLKKKPELKVYTQEEIGKRLQALIPDKKLLEELAGYRLVGIESKTDLNRIMAELETRETRVTGATLVE